MDFIFDPYLVLYLPLYKLDGVSFTSRDAYGHQCTATGALWTPQGRYFDGTDDTIDCGSASVLDALTGNLTIETWVYPNSSGEAGFGRVFEKGSSLDSFMGGAGVETINFTIKIGGVPKTPSNTLTYKTWHHVVFHYDGAEVLLTVDNVRSAGVAASGAIDSHSASNLYIGNESSTNRTWDGLIGEVRVYSRALSPLEIHQNYLATKWRYR